MNKGCARLGVLCVRGVRTPRTVGDPQARRREGAVLAAVRDVASAHAALSVVVRDMGMRACACCGRPSGGVATEVVLAEPTLSARAREALASCAYALSVAVASAKRVAEAPHDAGHAAVGGVSASHVSAP